MRKGEERPRVASWVVLIFGSLVQGRLFVVKGNLPLPIPHSFSLPLPPSDVLLPHPIRHLWDGEGHVGQQQQGPHAVLPEGPAGSLWRSERPHTHSAVCTWCHQCNISCEKGRTDADQFCPLTVFKYGRSHRHVTHRFPYFVIIIIIYFQKGFRPNKRNGTSL